jgi:hypothetical protein
MLFVFCTGHRLIFHLITATIAGTLSRTKLACPDIWGLFFFSLQFIVRYFVEESLAANFSLSVGLPSCENAS